MLFGPQTRHALRTKNMRHAQDLDTSGQRNKTMRHAGDLEKPILKPCAALRIYSTPKKNTPRRGSGAFRTDELRHAEDPEITSGRGFLTL